MDAFEAVADPVRRDLLVRLAGGPVRVVDLAAELPISRPAVSRHLRVLTGAGLVDVDARGRERHYRLREAGLVPVRDWLRGLAVPPFGESALDGLDLEVRRTGRERRADQHRTPQEEFG